MPIPARGRHRRRVQFPAQTTPAPAPAAGNLDRRLREAESASASASAISPVPKIMTTTAARAGVSTLFTVRPLIRDPLVTETSQLQDETVDVCLPFLQGTAAAQKPPFNVHGVPALQRDSHVAYLYDSLEDYPAGFVGLDASRPWMVYWALAGLSLLGEDVTKFRRRVCATFTPIQNQSGGFGGGHGQISHCAPTYATILSLAMVGGDDAFKLVDRTAMWRWLGRLKQPDGSFRVCEGGEEDVRGAYCAMVIISLLDLPLTLPPDAEARKHGVETFTSGLAEYLSRCQTYEGGISASPGTEAHGAYAFCALACLCILGEPEQTINRHMDVPLLLSWLSARQYGPEGGYSGRTNKLVDGCYSHWVGNCWPLVQAALNGRQSAASPTLAVGNLYSREGLTRYILSCCQAKNGGLRDKPGKHQDSYHTCYTLAGLSTTQYHHYHTDSSTVLAGPFNSAFSWQYLRIAASEAVLTEPSSDASVFSEGDRLAAFHPLYVIPHQAAASMHAWCSEQRWI
ncbi:hypothetical protein ASPZODRAFT_135526 [Penicilliopsis zonata CBS 506.65]|uniref:Protein farnesyltransferase subunit beta n=1 Tax=Penicilliopsis zonata CBS 506.65 TaxID=1073090 RepID=A0A1L9SAB3_9EURO|nr:hypothetical protein ASPZODRAFT_135526 [Penicilliopsis zonata CBS 506.65]OJJ44076.1 hypothetical protein ASPZODRAFT_135526 [Penicilliopsis zonata CBS 506.65]